MSRPSMATNTAPVRCGTVVNIGRFLSEGCAGTTGVPRWRCPLLPRDGETLAGELHRQIVLRFPDAGQIQDDAVLVLEAQIGASLTVTDLGLDADIGAGEVRHLAQMVDDSR